MGVGECVCVDECMSQNYKRMCQGWHAHVGVFVICVCVCVSKG